MLSIDKKIPNLDLIGRENSTRTAMKIGKILVRN
jgi:hypothetical protein